MNKKEIGEKIRTVREKKGLTQAELAEKVHVSSSSLCRWEKGEYEPSIEFIEQICIVLGISVEELLGLREKVDIHPEKEKKGKWVLMALSAVSILVVLFFITFPKYRVVDVRTQYVDNQGETAIVKAVPTLWFNEKQAEKYSKHLKKEYSQKKEYEALEIWFSPSENLINDYNDALLIITYMLKAE